MLATRSNVWIFAVGLMGAGMVYGQNYPTKPIRIFTAEPGSTGDTITRLIGPGVSELLTQPVVVENRPGFISSETVSKAPPDGYTLIVSGLAFWTAPLLRSTNYDPVRDFSPISTLVTQPTILVVHPSLPVKSVKELIALAKGRPGELNYSAQGVGGATHLAAELFKSMAGVNIVRVNYKASGAALIDLMAGQIQLSFPSLSTVAPYVKSGRLKALAVASAKPSALAPDLPTIAASGVPGYESGSTSVMSAPAKTPEAIIKRLNQEIVRVLNRPDVKEKFLTNGAEVVGSSPEELAAMMKGDMVRLGKVIKDAGIKAD